MTKNHDDPDSTLYEYSRLLDIHRVSDYPGATHAISEVFEEVKAHIRRTGRVKHPGRLRKHLSIVMLDLYLAAHQYPAIFRSVSRARDDYAPETRNYKLHLSYRLMVRVLDTLVDLEYINEARGFYNRDQNRGFATGAGRLTRICATEKLVACMNRRGMNPMFVSRWPSEMIELRDEDRKTLSFEATEESRRMQKNMERINQALEGSLIELRLKDENFEELHSRMARDIERAPLDLNNKFLVRIFNGSFERGGRCFGGFWQTIPSELRTFVEIDHKQTIEIDYSGMHVRILYAMNGLQCPEDPYDLKQFSREDQKIAMLCMLNASSEDQAALALRRKGIRGAVEMLKVLQERHGRIQEYFYTGVGLQLMRIESDIAEEVMLRIIDRDGVCLPVHDSFLVDASRETQLREAMEVAFQSRFPNATSVPLKAQKTMAQVERENRPGDAGLFVTNDLKKLLEGYGMYYQRLRERARMKEEIEKESRRELKVEEDIKS